MLISHHQTINNNKTKNMKTINKQVNTFKQLDTFEKIQVSIFGTIMTLLLGVVINWGVSGFITASF